MVEPKYRSGDKLVCIKPPKDYYGGAGWKLGAVFTVLYAHEGYGDGRVSGEAPVYFSKRGQLPDNCGVYEYACEPWLNPVDATFNKLKEEVS